jgi:hypothetical protein
MKNLILLLVDLTTAGSNQSMGDLTALLRYRQTDPPPISGDVTY